MSIEGLTAKADLERFVKQILDGTPMNYIEGLPEKLMPGSWQAATLESGWANDGVYADAQYRIETGGRVTFRGAIGHAGGEALESRILTLPPAFRPTDAPDAWQCLDSSGTGVVVVNPSGEVLYLGGSGPVEFLSLTAIAFWTS